ncbi:50S ribosomal protein L25, partial [Flavobacteriales bacterium]|nr:50S ribosomal protein L25 [Flavobacteriales bacterium]
LSIRSTPENLPDNVTIDIAPMTIGEKVYVKDLEAPNFDILTAGSSVIVAVKTARGVVVEDEEEAAADAPATDAPAAE